MKTIVVSRPQAAIADVARSRAIVIGALGAIARRLSGAAAALNGSPVPAAIEEGRPLPAHWILHAR